MKQKIITQNIYMLPFIMSFSLFGFLFIALFSSNYFFDKTVLFSAAFIVLLWCCFFLVSLIKEKNIKINLYNIFLFIVFALFCLHTINRVWFSGYLRIDAITSFFNGKFFIDPLYQSAIAESIVTNGYPSIQQNAPNFLSIYF